MSDRAEASKEVADRDSTETQEEEKRKRGTYVIRIEKLGTGEPTPFDGQYLKEYDPGRDGSTPDGREMVCHLVATSNVAEAKRFDGIQAADVEWMQFDPRGTLGENGEPNRPLAAFSVSIEWVDD